MFATNAYAMAGGGGQQAAGGGGAEGIIMLLVMFAIFYFLLIRPQQKRAKQHKELVEALKSGDKVITAGGLHGKVVTVEENVITLEIARDVRIKMNRASVVSVESGESAA